MLLIFTPLHQLLLHPSHLGLLLTVLTFRNWMTRSIQLNFTFYSLNSPAHRLLSRVIILPRLRERSLISTWLLSLQPELASQQHSFSFHPQTHSNNRQCPDFRPDFCCTEHRESHWRHRRESQTDYHSSCCLYYSCLYRFRWWTILDRLSSQ
jgi:hypothetical protein